MSDMETLSKLYLELANVVPKGTISSRELRYIDGLRKIQEIASRVLDHDPEGSRVWEICAVIHREVCVTLVSNDPIKAALEKLGGQDKSK